uniref:Uncharacterized protein n=1 Tax=Knipowitschia caucasica TaxID=637954 RepID=A0AAV2KKE7_KNICA
MLCVGRRDLDRIYSVILLGIVRSGSWRKELQKPENNSSNFVGDRGFVLGIRDLRRPSGSAVAPGGKSCKSLKITLQKHKLQAKIISKWTE